MSGAVLTPDCLAGGPVDAYERLVRELDLKAQNAARRAKPTMWAYYSEMAQALRDAFENVPQTDGSYAGAALAISQNCVREVENLQLDAGRAAECWALGIYARRILAAWGAGNGGPVSLGWLRKRAGV
jgi:hypothetical protein